MIPHLTGRRYETIHLLSLSIQDEMGETWLLARSRALSEERMKHEGYERKKQKQMYQQASDVKHDVT
jgi:hypothetical protein